jgi:hypothetical protein
VAENAEYCTYSIHVKSPALAWAEWSPEWRFLQASRSLAPDATLWDSMKCLAGKATALARAPATLGTVARAAKSACVHCIHANRALGRMKAGGGIPCERRRPVNLISRKMTLPSSPGPSPVLQVFVVGQATLRCYTAQGTISGVSGLSYLTIPLEKGVLSWL